MNCKNCGQEIDKKAIICPNCGVKQKKPIFKKWWFWLIIAFIIIIIAITGGNDNSDTISNNSQVTSSQEIIYEQVELQTMLDELESNALKAEKTYNDKHIEITGKISNFDSDGNYISIEPVNAGEWNFESVMCYIKNDDQLNFLLEKSTGDTVTIKGKVKSVGEVLGYSLDIAEVQ